MRIVSVAAVLGLMSAAVALAAPAPSEPAKDVQKEPQDRVVSGSLTPADLLAEIEKAAAKRQQEGGAPNDRGRFYRFHAATEAGEFEALGRYAVMLLTVLSQKSEELPVKRVYIRADGKEVPVQPLSSWRSEVDATLLSAKIFGRFREDGFYLLPMGSLLRDGQVLIDLAANRTGWTMMALPSNGAKASRAATFANTDPAPNAKPDLKALQAFVRKKFPGFPVPTSVP
jgi:hypothetical protein